MLASLLTLLVIPPVNLLLLAVATLLAARRWPATGRAVAGLSLLALLLLGLPAVSGPLLYSLETDWPADLAARGATPGAIVILGGDARTDLPGGDVGPLTLQRLRGGAAAARASGLPVLVTGGVVGDGNRPLAFLMARSLHDDFAISARWLEPLADDTWQNARFSAALLHGDGVASAYLVTHAWHMRRALIAFAAAGLPVLPAPLPFHAPAAWSAANLVPRLSGWQDSYFAIHEWLGIAWYSWRRAHSA